MERVFLFILFVSLAIQANTELISTNDSSRDKYEISIGYLIFDVSDENSPNSEFSGKGYSLSAGRIFKISENITATTSAIYGHVTFDSDDFGVEVESSKVTEYGITQRFSYKIQLSKQCFIPFFELSYLRGSFSSQVNTIDSGVNYSYSSVVYYLKRGLNLGLQLQLKSGITPFVKVEYNNVQFSKAYFIKLDSDGVSKNIVLSLDGDNDSTTLSSTIVGLSYTF